MLRRDAADGPTLLMAAGADARKGIYPHRDATTALSLSPATAGTTILSRRSKKRNRHRREAMSCPNVTVSPVQEQINTDRAKARMRKPSRCSKSDSVLIRACDRDGRAHCIGRGGGNERMVELALDPAGERAQTGSKGFTPLDRAALAADPRNARAQFPAVARRLLAREPT